MPAPLYPQATTAAEITANLAHINARIAAANYQDRKSVV